MPCSKHRIPIFIITINLIKILANGASAHRHSFDIHSYQDEIKTSVFDKSRKPNRNWNIPWFKHNYHYYLICGFIHRSFAAASGTTKIQPPTSLDSTWLLQFFLLPFQQNHSHSNPSKYLTRTFKKERFISWTYFLHEHGHTEYRNHPSSLSYNDSQIIRKNNSMQCNPTAKFHKSPSRKNYIRSRQR